jgi:hypothetical protein
VFGTRLAEERKRLKLNQKELGDLLGVGRSAIAMIETDRAGLDGMRVASLRSAGFDVQYLLFGVRQSLDFGQGLDWDLLFAIIDRVTDRCRRKKIRLPPEKMKVIVKHVYLQLAERGEIDEATVDSILRVAA